MQNLNQVVAGRDFHNAITVKSLAKGTPNPKNLNVSHLVLELSWSCRQVMLQLHLQV